MSIQQLLGEMPKCQFVAEHFHRLPFSLAGGAAAFRPLGTWQSLGEILAREQVDVMVVRRGRRWDGQPPRSAESARQLADEGYTVLVRHAERHDPRLAELAAAFQHDFGGQVNIHIYATPGEQFGFGWHYDAEEVFIVQTTGVKEYSLRKNTVNPWPLVETLPADMRYEREIMPLMRCTLHAGDWLYIPSGYWHMAAAQETAISLAIGVLAPTGLDVFDAMRPQLLESMLWRQRLPVAGDASPLADEQLRDEYRRVLGELAADLQRLASSDRMIDRLISK